MMNDSTYVSCYGQESQSIALHDIRSRIVDDQIRCKLVQCPFDVSAIRKFEQYYITVSNKQLQLFPEVLEICYINPLVPDF